MTIRIVMGQLMGLCHRGMRGDTECVFIVLGILANLSVGHGGETKAF